MGIEAWENRELRNVCHRDEARGKVGGVIVLAGEEGFIQKRVDATYPSDVEHGSFLAVRLSASSSIGRVVGSIEPTNTAIYLPLLNPNPDLESGLASRHCLICRRCPVFAASLLSSLLSPECSRACFSRLDYVADTISAVVSLRRRSLQLAAVTTAACRRHCYSSRSQVSSSSRFYC
ncbi:hypothetical protein BHE74_00047757 [Ensete ventricosum]|nr:hypothetical protein BHE74_00047757 [Ensete ventricosum]